MTVCHDLFPWLPVMGGYLIREIYGKLMFAPIKIQANQYTMSSVNRQHRLTSCKHCHPHKGDLSIYFTCSTN
jgi:hypothetical protein